MDRSLGSEFIGRKLPRYLALIPQRLAEETLSRPAVPAFSDQNIDHIPTLIHRLPKVESLASDRDEEFINVPDVAKSSLFSSQASGIGRSTLYTPASNCLIEDGDSPFNKEIFNVAKAECKPVIEPHRVADDFWWKVMAFVTDNHALIVIDPADCTST